MKKKEADKKEPPKLKQDLIADDSNFESTKDSIGHEKIVEQLTALVKDAATPTNIALYGPWGSGKTTIGALLGNELKDDLKGISFVRFDAFKYVDLSLRRNFIKVIAKELYDHELIRRQTWNEIKKKLDTASRSTNKVKLSWWIFPLFFILYLWSYIYDKLSIFLPASLLHLIELAPKVTLPIAVLLPPLLTLTSLQVTKNVSSPKEEDEFEEIFESMIKKSFVERLIIFVDELDRCSANDMIKTLDSIRTFFDIKKCIIIIAVDKNVLETAIEKENQQATPVDEGNPYYSMGGAYLDKVFKYQISIPPFWKNQGIEYATSLVEDKNEGLWSEIKKEERKSILEILIPDYVVSPRRVKNLLNSFVLLYRLAEDKKVLADSENKIKIVARLACLQVEFPNFARDMLKNANLPKHVLMLNENPDSKIDDIDEEAAKIAQAYAENKRSTAKLVSKLSSGDANRVIDKLHGKRLISYLSNTRNIDCPSFDLLYLDSDFKDNFGLRGLVVDNLFYFAKNNEIANFSSEFQKLDDEDCIEASRQLISRISDEKSRNNDNAVNTIAAFMDKLPEYIDETSRVLFIKKVLILAAHDDSETLNRDNVREMWKICDKVDTWRSYILRSYIIERCVLLEGIGLADIDFLFDDVGFIFDISPDFALDIVVRMLYSPYRHRLIRKIFEMKRSHLIEILPLIIYKLSFNEDLASIRDVFRNIAAVGLGCGRDIIEAILLPLVQIELQKSKDAVDSLLFSGFTFDNPQVLAYVFNNIFSVSLHRQIVWLRHISPSSINETHLDILIKLYVSFMTDSEQISRSDFIDMERLIYSFIDAVNNENKDEIRTQIIDQIRLDEDIKSELTDTNVIRRYDKVLGERGIMDTSEQVDAFMKRVLGAIGNAMEGMMSAGELETLLKETLGEGEFDVVKSGISGVQIERLLRSLMRCEILDPSLRFVFISIVSEAISTDFLSGGEQVGLPPVDRLSGLLEHYGGLAIKPLLSWMKLHSSPVAAAKIFYTLFVEHLLDNSGFAASLYRGWNSQEMSAFWAECFKYVSFYAQDIGLIRAFALNQVSEDDKVALANWLMHAFDQYKDIRQREMIIKLWMSADINFDLDRVRDKIILPLLEQHLDAEGGSISSVLLGIAAVEKLLPKGFICNDSELQDHLGSVVDKTPELWMPVERIIQPVL